MHLNSRSAGFTLIEILVVMVIVGLLATLAVVNLGSGNERRELDNSVRQLYLLMQTASEQAIVNNQELGVVLTDNGYRFVLYNDTSDEWVEQPDRLFSPRVWPDWAQVTPIIDNDIPRLTKSEEAVRPDIVFFSSGEITPFELSFAMAQQDGTLYRIESADFDQLSLSAPGDDGSGAKP